MNIIQTDNLVKRFGNTIAVNKVSVHVKEGEIYGFLGLNGAGKTTMIRLLLGLIRPDSGSYELFGKKSNRTAELWNQVGYMIETPYAYPDLTVTENLEVIYKLRNLSERSLIPAIIDRLQLTRYRNKKFKHLSMGNKQRVGLAKALMHKPRLLILDEPVNGLDPAGIVEVRELLKELVANFNTTIFLSSHILSEIAKLTNRIGIIHEGQIIREINADDLHEQVLRKLQINTGDNPKALQVIQRMNLNASIINGFIESDDRKALAKPEWIAKELVLNEVPPIQLFIFEEDLEHYFLRIIKTKGV